MKEKIKIIGILVLAGFSFLYTEEVSKIIKKNDPIMKEIDNVKEEYVVSKVDRVTIEDEYLTGINGCVVDEYSSYNKMKNEGSFKEELMVMKEDEILKEDNSSYIIGGNKKNRNVSIILLDYNYKLDEYFKENNIKINYFLDANYIKDNIDKLINIGNNSKIYNYGRNKKYLSKYIVYDNNLITSNFNNESNYCLIDKKDEEVKKICGAYDMKVIKSDIISNNMISYVKNSLTNGKIFVFSTHKDITIIINYIRSKGYNIVDLDDLLNENNKCN